MKNKKGIGSKKALKELGNNIYEAMKPFLDASSADRIAQEENMIYQYFRKNQNDSDLRVRDVSIDNGILDSKVLITFQDRDNNFTMQKFNYEKLIGEIKEKIEANYLLYYKVLGHYKEFIEKFVGIIHSFIKNCDQANDFEEIFNEFNCSFTKLTELQPEQAEYYTVNSKELEGFNEIIKSLAKKVGVEFDSDEELTEASVRELLDKNTLLPREAQFLISATNYLKEKTNKNNSLKEYDKFSKLSYDEKIKISYYEILFNKLTEGQFSLSKKAMTGQMMNKLFVEHSQKSKRKDNELMEKVLSDESLEDQDYSDLTFMDIKYNNMDIHTLLNSYTKEDILKRLEVYEKLMIKDPKHKRLYEERINILEKWRKLIHIFKNCDECDLEEFADDLFYMHLSDVERYINCYENGEEYDTNKDLFDYQYILMFKKIIEFIDNQDETSNCYIFVIKKNIENYLRIIEKNEYLIKISKTLRNVSESYPKDVFDYQRVIEACYNSYSRLAVLDDSCTSNCKLREIVNEQVKALENGMSLETVSLIRDDILILPKEFIKK